MKISWISALVVLPAVAATGGTPWGGVKGCKKSGNKEVKLLHDESIKRKTNNAGICTNGWTFGITTGKGKLQLLRGNNDIRWKAKDGSGVVVEGIEECVMEFDSFVCYDEFGTTLWTLDCDYLGGEDPFMHLNQDDDDFVLRMRGDNNEKFKVKKNGNEDGTCMSPPNNV